MVIHLEKSEVRTCQFWDDNLRLLVSIVPEVNGGLLIPVVSFVGIEKLVNRGRSIRVIYSPAPVSFITGRPLYGKLPLA